MYGRAVSVRAVHEPFSALAGKVLIWSQFTWKNIQEEVDADQEVTFSYPFRMDPSLESMTLQMAMTVFYSDESEEFSNTFFNQTVQFVHLGSTVDYGFVARIVVGFLVGASILTWLYMDMTKKKTA